MADSPHDRLDSWKEIAAYLKRNERTAMRWAQRLGLPVHRIPGTHHGSVFAYKSEIDAWLEGRHASAVGSRTLPNSGTQESSGVEAPAATFAASSRRLRVRSIVQSTVVAMAVGGMALLLVTNLLPSLRSRHTLAGLVTRISFTYNAVVAWNGNKQLWKYQFPHRVYAKFWNSEATISDFTRIVDVGRGNNREVIVVAPLRLNPNPEGLYETVVYCFSDAGKLLWSYVPREEFQFGKYTLQGPWYVTALYVSENGSNPSVWIAAEHYIWGNSFVAQLDLVTGRASLRFVNTGVLYALDEVKGPNGNRLLVGGFNNEYSAGIMAVINEKKPFAVSPQTPGTRHQCVSCAPGVPDEYFVFPRTEINRVEGAYQDPITTIQVSEHQIQVSKAEAFDLAGASTIYQFTADATIRPTSLRYDTSYDMLYRRLQKEGRIRHSMADSAERLHPQPVAVWTPSTDWAECDFKPPGIASAETLPISKPPRYSLAAVPGR